MLFVLIFSTCLCLLSALKLALAAGPFFDVGSSTEYAVTIVGKCIEAYIALRSKQQDSEENVDMDPRLEDIVEGMFEKCYTLGTFKEALGVALEAQRLDKVEDTILKSGSQQPEMLSHCLKVCQTLVPSRKFRLDVMRVLERLYARLDDPNHLELCVCLHYLGDVHAFSEHLQVLVREDYLVAYQAVFDLVDLRDQKFVTKLLKALPTPKKEDEDGADEEDERMRRIRAILGEGIATALHLDFLYRRNKTDMLLVKNIKTLATETGTNEYIFFFHCTSYNMYICIIVLYFIYIFYFYNREKKLHFTQCNNCCTWFSTMWYKQGKKKHKTQNYIQDKSTLKKKKKKKMCRMSF